MAQRTRRENRPSATTPEQNAMAREMFNLLYADLRAQDQAAVDKALSGASQVNPETPGDPTSGTSEPSTDGDSPTENPTADPPPAGSPGGTTAEPFTVDTAHVRTWAQAHPTLAPDLPNHGRLPEHVRTAYLAEFPGHVIAAAEGKKSKTPAPLVPIPEDAISFDEVPEEEWESHPLSPAPVVREAWQVRFDNRVKDVYDRWVAAGKPEVRKAPRDRIAIPPEFGAAARKALMSAGTLHKVLVKIQPVSHDPQGRQVIVFTAMDRPAKPKPEEKPETKPEPSDAEKTAMDEAKTENDAAA